MATINSIMKYENVTFVLTKPRNIVKSVMYIIVVETVKWMIGHGINLNVNVYRNYDIIILYEFIRLSPKSGCTAADNCSATDVEVLQSTAATNSYSWDSNSYSNISIKILNDYMTESCIYYTYCYLYLLQIICLKQ